MTFACEVPVVGSSERTINIAQDGLILICYLTLI